MVRRIHIAFAAAVAACTTSPTRIELAVTADPTWQIDHYELRIGDHAVGAAPLSTLQLQLPDEMAGHQQDVSVWGLAGGTQVAYGSTSVTPAMHGTVSAAVTLTAITCGTFCTEGAVECMGNGITTCQMQTNGCLAWSSPMACPSAMPYCSNGTCSAQCSDECMTGQTECDSPATVRMCGQFDSDSCLDWSAPMACGHGETCTGGTCMATTTCAHNGDSCDDGDACTEHDMCENGVCSGTPKCTAPPDADATCSGGTCGFNCHVGLMKSGAACVIGSLAAMPTPRATVAVLSPDGRIYTIGGLDDATLTRFSKVEAYDVPSNTWSTRASLPTALNGHAAVRGPDGLIYAIGGFDGSSFVASVNAYDVTTNHWTSRPAMPSARVDLGAAVGSDNRIYAIGGYYNATQLTTVEAYNTTTNSWVARSPLPAPRSAFAVVAGPDGRIYVIGGLDPTSDTATVFAYDAASNTWTTRASMHTARDSAAAAVGSDGLIYVIGGENGAGPLKTVEAYNPATNTWTVRAAMPTARWGLGAVLAANGLIYAAGGADVSDNPLGTLEAYSAASNTW
jgi:N-acetylneuraminic acid mutarotase